MKTEHTTKGQVGFEGAETLAAHAGTPSQRAQAWASGRGMAASVLAAALAFGGGACSKKAEGPSPAAAAADAGGASDSSGGAMWGANYFPNIPLVTHEGKAVRFFDDLIKDKVVAVNFIYTQCADACPMETARMLEVQRLLADRLGKDIFFYSISIDPAHDTPEVLKKYAETWKTGPGWTFLTGKDEDITHLRQKLGVYEADLTKKDHNLNLIIGNQRTGRWMKRSPSENPYILATQLGSWLHNWKLPSQGDRNYANAPAIRTISTGEELFRGRCRMCHTIGEGDRSDVKTRRVGPDLLNVTKQRDRKWLTRWIMEPDQMLAEKDPLALQLFERYHQVPMPNLRMDAQNTADVLKYIEEESAGVERRAALAHQAATGGKAAPGPSGAKGGAAPVTPPAPALVTEALPKEAHGALRALLPAYERMRARFAADDFAGAKAEAAALTSAAAALASQASASGPLVLEMASVARAIGGAAEMEAARLGFGRISRNLIAILVATPTLRGGLHLFRCPMAKGYQKWIQPTTKLYNPYWGSRMLHCGKLLGEWSV